MRRCDRTAGSSGRGGKTEDGGGLGAIVDSLNARLVTESRKVDFDIGPGSEIETWSGAGGSEDVGAGRGGGIDDRVIWIEVGRDELD